ncbi:precorrin-6y C5,15-methyltransferase (decarboxylating) subunit CbiE [Paracoccus luteus]|uniref:precorrin-6y C5,15-methyltransferase (decarboxylating) subunit CbiE n=1 Tax=Paracoccus luteus TaxID=2508543 RepID=UPI001070260F|nr:precorrin-6y C5,15-methyltransferase (decarboxylating) subunit CbiE [Paracoccus luteus]
MAEWLSIIGMGEDGPEGLTPAARAALEGAGVVFGGPRHLALAGAGDRGRAWPVPFDIAPVLACRGLAVAVLASGDPFWFGAGGALAAALRPDEWRAFPAPGVVSLAAARMGWRIEDTACLGLHAAPFDGLAAHLRPGARIIATLRDGPAAGALAGWLMARGWGDTALSVMERLGGPRERLRATTAAGFDLTDVQAPVAVALTPQGGVPRPRGPGLPDDAFAHDGQITRRPVRVLTLAALAPAPGAVLWDLGAGSGSVSIEWALAGGRAIAVERRADRAANIAANIARFALAGQVTAITADSAALPDLPAPDAVFVGGGLTEGLAQALWDRLPPGARIVANAVTLETESLLAALHARHGGSLLRIELAEAAPLGGLRGWTPSRPVVQWAVTR